MERFINFSDGSEDLIDLISVPTNPYPQLVAQDTASTYDCTSQDMQAEPLFFSHQNSFITRPEITFQQSENEYFSASLPSVQNHPSACSIHEIPFHHPGRKMEEHHDTNKTTSIWCDIPGKLDAPQQVSSMQSPNFTPAEDPDTGGQSAGQITFPIVINKSTTSSVHCFNCKATRTPLWRRTPDREHFLCNACGLYYKQYGRDRPTLRNRQQRAKMTQQQNQSPSEKESLRCANCSHVETPLWRKNHRGETICNACGLYAKIHNCDRPVKMHKTTIQRRRPSSYFGIDDASDSAIAVTKALPSGFCNDSEYISQVRKMGTKDAVRDALAVTKRRCDFLELVLSYMENSNHPSQDQCI